MSFDRCIHLFRRQKVFQLVVFVQEQVYLCAIIQYRHLVHRDHLDVLRQLVMLMWRFDNMHQALFEREYHLNVILVCLVAKHRGKCRLIATVL